MCGRFTLHTNQKKLAQAIGLTLPSNYEPDYNIGPGRETIAIAHYNKQSPNCIRMLWGLRTPQNFHINARVETAEHVPRFRESWAEHRCLIPANGFYEWYQDGITKQPYYLYPHSDELCYFAGLWFPPEDDSIATCIILTTEANACVKKIHHRMPLILPRSVHADWLCTSLKKREAQTLTAEVALQSHSVSRRVNSVHNHDNRLIEATNPLSDDQMLLF